MTTEQPDLQKVEDAVKKLTREEDIPQGESRDLDPIEAMSKADREALVAQLLDKGRVASRLVVKDADPSRYYTWVREREQDIQRMQALHFRIETEAGEGSHGTASNIRRVGDVILMSCHIKIYEAIDAVRTQRKAARSNLGKKEYLRSAAMNRDVPVVDPLGVGKE